MFLVVLVVFASWFSLFLVGPPGARPTISFAVHQICSFLVIYSRGEPKGKVLSARPRHRLEKQHRDSHLSRPRGLIAFKVYPFAPGEYQKARFYPLSPGTGGRLSCDPFGPAPGENTQKENTES